MIFRKAHRGTLLSKVTMFVLWDLSRVSPFITQLNYDLKFKSLRAFTDHHCPRSLAARLNGSLWDILLGRRRWLVRIRFLQQLFANLLRCMRAGTSTSRSIDFELEAVNYSKTLF